MKKTISSFAALVTAFVGQHADAKANNQVVLAEKMPVEIPAENLRSQSEKLSVVAEGQKFDFVLKNSAKTGEMMAYHYSHSSHASHASHRSHSSSRY